MPTCTTRPLAEIRAEVVGQVDRRNVIDALSPEERSALDAYNKLVDSVGSDVLGEVTTEMKILHGVMDSHPRKPNIIALVSAGACRRLAEMSMSDGHVEKFTNTAAALASAVNAIAVMLFANVDPTNESAGEALLDWAEYEGALDYLTDQVASYNENNGWGRWHELEAELMAYIDEHGPEV